MIKSKGLKNPKNWSQNQIKSSIKNNERDITRIEGSFQNQEPDNIGWEVIKSYIQSEEWYKVGEEQWKNCRQFSKSG
jgi:hypothetical protein